MAVLRVAFLSSLALEFFATVSIAMVAVYIGFRLYYRRNARSCRASPCCCWRPSSYRPLRTMGAQYHARMEAIGAAEAIVALLHDRRQPAAAHRAGAALRRRAAPLRQVALRAASGFGYGRWTPVLARRSTSRSRGAQRVALVGPSGAGKTTAQPAPARLSHADRGPRSPSTASTSPTLSPAAWRAARRLAAATPDAVPRHAAQQHPASPAPTRPAAASADALDRRRAPTLDRIAYRTGSTTMLGDRGQGLSGGEIQRIALARIFLNDADLVVLDEPAAALDAETAALVTRSIDALSTAARCWSSPIGSRPSATPTKSWCSTRAASSSAAATTT